jgi:hypothetical protein
MAFSVPHWSPQGPGRGYEQAQMEGPGPREGQALPKVIRAESRLELVCQGPLP